MKGERSGVPQQTKVRVLGVDISTADYADVTSSCKGWIEERRRAQRPDGGKAIGRFICVTSVHGIVTALKRPRFQAILNQAALATPDGMPVVWALRSFGARKQSRVYGPTLMLKLCEQAAANGHRVFLYGATEETLERLVRHLQGRYPALEICGTYAPPFRPLTARQDAECTSRILDSGADLVFVGIGTPKQEAWMAEHVDRLKGAVLIGVGAAFDFHAGRVKQAPPWMQRTGFEWLFRLLMEPRRLWKRYLLETPVFLPLWALQRLGVLRY